MMTRRAIATIPLLLAASCQCCRSFSADDEAAIRKASLAWAAAANAKDHATLAALYTDDAALMPPNLGTVKGRDGVRGFMSGMPPFTGMTLVPVEVRGSGGWAYVWGNYSMSIEMPGGTPPLKDRGKYIEIWQKGKDGAWSIHRDIFNSDLPMPGH